MFYCWRSLKWKRCASLDRFLTLMRWFLWYTSPPICSGECYGGKYYVKGCYCCLLFWGYHNSWDLTRISRHSATTKTDAFNTSLSCITVVIYSVFHTIKSFTIIAFFHSRLQIYSRREFLTRFITKHILLLLYIRLKCGEYMKWRTEQFREDVLRNPPPLWS